MVEIQISTSELTNTQIFYSELVDSLYKKNFRWLCDALKKAI
jgi:hypothetical protein